MTQDSTPPLERFLEGTARRLGGGGLHPLELLQRIQAAVEASARDGRAANDIRVAMNPADFQLFSAEADRVRQDVTRALDRLEGARGWTRIGERLLSFEPSEAVQAGLPRVTARFADRSHRQMAPAPAGATQRLARHRDVDIVLGDGSRIALTHTPFTIGRGPANDLVVLSFAVSREHAEIRVTPRGFVIVDRGSRNGVVVGGERRESVDLVPGRSVMLGDVELRIEARP